MRYYGKILLGMTMGIVVAGFVTAVATASYSADREYLTALEWMHQSGMTKYTTSSGYNPGGDLLREHAAKFFVQYAKQQGLEPVVDSDCAFGDIASADSSLRTFIEEACGYGILRGSQGNYYPKQVMTKAQALTVLVRIEAGLQNESVSPRWKNNFIKARELGLTKETDVRAVDKAVSRYEMALLLSRAAGVTVPSATIDPELEETLRLMGMLTNYLRTE